MKTRTLIAVLLLTSAAVSAQQPVKKTLRTEQKFAIAPGGTFVLDNTAGNIQLASADVTEVEATIVTLLSAATKEALEDGRRHSSLLIGGDTRTRIVRTAIANQKKPWSAIVHWNVRVPRNVNVRIMSTASDHVRVSDIGGSVYIKNFNGNIEAYNIAGGTYIESVNGSIIYNTLHPRRNVLLSTINGHITATVAGDADFRWVAETSTGDIRTSLAPRGTFRGATFHGSVNAPGGPTITTHSLMGNIHLLAAGASATATVSLRREPMIPGLQPTPRAVVADMTSAAPKRILRLGTVKTLTHKTSLGDVQVNEVLGNADIYTGGGNVQLGAVNGTCTVRSDGGPMQLGEILGVLNASTRAGDVFVDSTRRGGTIATDGGTIRLLYTSGPTRLTSGGGDIVVRQAAAPVTAQTTSGDVTITVDPALKSEQIEARTGQGNVVLNVSAAFRADIDATIVTDDPKADTIVSDIPGLSISREQVNGKTRIRATGKLNGGGDKVVLNATGGDIRIATTRLSPTIVRR
ncbi:MAG: DUF4097 family beta strand repeat-containing protein [Thermoanaerobaculia bacterium]